MTLIVGFVHEDFALLFADKRATTKGPTTLTMGNITINAKDGVSITGYNKVTLNVDRSIIVGIAGYAQAHDYLGAFGQAKDFKEALAILNSFTNRFSSPLERIEYSDAQKLNNRQYAIAPYFDSEKMKFAMARFTANEYILEKESLTSLPTHYILRCAGSGAVPFMQLVNTPEAAQLVNNFLPPPQGQGHGLQNIGGLTDLMKKLYKAVSCVDSAVSEEVDIWIATKSSPIFTPYS